MAFFCSYWQFWHKFTQVVKDKVSAIGMHVGIEGSESKSEVDLFFYDLKLLFVSFGGDLTEILRNLGFADDKDAFVLEEGAERYLNETLVGSDWKKKIVVVEFPFQEFVGLLVEEQGGFGVGGRWGPVSAGIESVQSEDYSFVVVGVVGRFRFDG